MHIPPFDNKNKALVDRNDVSTPLVYFNIVKLQAGENFSYQLADYESCVVPATGRVLVNTRGEDFGPVGLRKENVWDAEPEGVYVPSGERAAIKALSACEVLSLEPTFPQA